MGGREVDDFVPNTGRKWCVRTNSRGSTISRLYKARSSAEEGRIEVMSEKNKRKYLPTFNPSRSP